MSKQRTIPKNKRETVEKLAELLKKHNTIGIVQMESIGAKTVQMLRADLRERAAIVVSKNTLMKRALKQAKIKGWDDLEKHISGPSAFLFTDDSPYQIANYLDKNKVKAPAKSGMISPVSVIIPKMNTGFPPGTVISELNSVGLPTRIEGGTVAIPQDTTVLEPGERISSTLASILTRLGIEPFLAGLSLDVVLENGEIISHADLVIDYDAYRNDLVYAYHSAFNLAVHAGIITSETAPVVLAKAKQNAIAIAAAIGYVTEETAPQVIGRANANVLALLRAVVSQDESAVPADLASMATQTATSTISTISSASKTETVEEDEEEEEGEEVENDGLGSLFG